MRGLRFWFGCAFSVAVAMTYMYSMESAFPKHRLAIFLTVIPVQFVAALAWSAIQGKA